MGWVCAAIKGRGVARIFKGGDTVCHSEGTQQIVMSFLPPDVGCLLKEKLSKGGHRHPRTPLATPLPKGRVFSHFSHSV